MSFFAIRDATDPDENSVRSRLGEPFQMPSAQRNYMIRQVSAAVPHPSFGNAILYRGWETTPSRFSKAEARAIRAYDGLGSHDQEATLPGRREPEREDPEKFIDGFGNRRGRHRRNMIVRDSLTRNRPRADEDL